MMKINGAFDIRQENFTHPFIQLSRILVNQFFQEFFLHCLNEYKYIIK